MSTHDAAQPLAITLENGAQVSGLALAPPGATRCFVFAHGAGAGMTHSFMSDFAEGLAARDIATLRYQFPFMEKGSRRPDFPAVAHAAVRAAVRTAESRWPGVRLIAGGKSFGARMTSQAQAERPLAGVRGLAFVGFPLHPEGKPSIERATHLARVSLPMLFLQGTRDGLADLALLEPMVAGLGARARLTLFDDADHAFHVRVKSGRNDAQVLAAMLDAFVDWAATL